MHQNKEEEKKKEMSSTVDVSTLQWNPSTILVITWMAKDFPNISYRSADLYRHYRMSEDRVFPVKGDTETEQPSVAKFNSFQYQWKILLEASNALAT